MDLDYDVYWCAVKGVTAADAITQVFGPNASLRAPASNETLRGRFDGYLEKRLSACFTKGDWTFFVAPEDIFVVETQFAGHEVVKLHCDSTNSWTTVEHWMNGAIDWSVYGAMEDDYVRATGALPANVEKFTAATTDCETVAIKVANAVTGFRHDKHERPRGFQIIEIRPPRELILPGQTVKDPSWDQVTAAIEHFLATPGAWVMLTVGAGGGATTIMANHAGDSVCVEHHGSPRRQAQRKEPMFHPIQPGDVLPIFEACFTDGKLAASYIWLGDT